MNNGGIFPILFHTRIHNHIDMTIQDQHITEFQMLYKKHFGITLTTGQALEKGLRLIRLTEVISQTEAKNRKDRNSNISKSAW
jgi:hypothetical protein